MIMAVSRRRYPFRRAVRRLLRKEIVPGRILIMSSLLGCVTGLVCAAFQILPDLMNAFRQSCFEDRTPDLPELLALLLSSGALAAFALFLTMRFAPEAGGSGIPEIEGALDRRRPVRWWRVLPVKLVGGVAALGSGMVLGREGPSIQIGGNLGKMSADLALLPRANSMALLAAGGAAGLAAAFNAPLAGIMFVLEELRPQFRYSFLAIKTVSVAVISATLIRCWILGSQPVFAELPVYGAPELAGCVWFAVLGVLAGIAGTLFNRAVGWFQDRYLALHQGRLSRALPVIFLLGGLYGILAVIWPEASGSGMASIPSWIMGQQTLSVLLLLLAVRILGILLCFCSGIPGGIFAPSLSLGVLLGAALGNALDLAGAPWFPGTGSLAVAGMCAIFAASVRAPVTGIVLAAEMSGNYMFILPMMITTLAATLTAQKLGGIPIYTQILNRTLRLAAAGGRNTASGGIPGRGPAGGS